MRELHPERALPRTVVGTDTWHMSLWHSHDARLPDLDLPQVEGGDAWIALARARLEAVCSRRTPMRSVRPSPVAGVGRIAFADGTVVLARSDRRGQLTDLALWVAREGVVVESVRASASEVVIAVCAPRSRPIAIAIVGVDQPD